jgi:hypothetical protein
MAPIRLLTSPLNLLKLRQAKGRQSQKHCSTPTTFEPTLEVAQKASCIRP